MSCELELQGIYVPLVTPLADDDTVALDELKRLAYKAADEGAAGIVALGTTGEPATLRPEERIGVISTIKQVCNERGMHCCVGAGSNDTRVSIDFVHQAADAGAESALVVVPYYTRPSEEGILAHYQAISHASPIPIIAYNIPYRTGRGLGAEAILRLADMPNIAGIKQAVGGVDVDTTHVLSARRDDFAVLCGDDPFLFPMLALGAQGAIGASAQLCTRGFVEMVRSAQHQNWKLARQLHEALFPVTVTLFSEPSPSVIKGVLCARGEISTSNLRLPMTGASAEAVSRACDVVEDAERRISALLS